MSYDIFFLRRDPGQSFEDALDGLEDSFEGGDPGPLSDDELEQWETLLPRARAILGERAEVTQDHEETRELSDPVTGIGLTFLEGEFEIHVPENRVLGDGDELTLMSTVYALARAVEEVTGLEGYDPQLGEPVSDASDLSPTRRVWADSTGEDDDERPPRGRRPQVGPSRRTGTGALDSDPFDPDPVDESPTAEGDARRWWELWRR